MTIHRSAKFSDDNLYRYWLFRQWDSFKKTALVIALNPSTASDEKDDPTIRRLINDLSDLGFGGFYIVNLYALISPKPSVLFTVPDALGDNDYWISHCALASQEIIFAWGNFKGIDYRAKKMIELFPDGKCFGKSIDGRPWHPLALMYKGVKRGDVQLIKYRS